uniref:adenosine receptor A2b-like n=1 Tax=Myxine glutinosa TaxID=7769 RepID=UPI00358EB006
MPNTSVDQVAHGHLDRHDLLYLTVEVVIALLAIAGNVLVCWAVLVNSNLHNVTNYLLVSLAVADIAVGVLGIPFAIVLSVRLSTNFYGCLFLACFVLVLTQSSIFSMLAVAIDRYLAVSIHLRYNELVTENRAKGIVAVCWILSFAIGLLPMLGWNNLNELQENCSKGFQNGSKLCVIDCHCSTIECGFEKVITLHYMVSFNFFGCVLGPLVVMMVIYLKIFMIARRQLRAIKHKGTGIPSVERSRTFWQKEMHAARSLSIIVIIFTISWLPLHIANCIGYYCQSCSRSKLLMYSSILLSHANSAMNPIVYAYRLREFRHTFRRILKQQLVLQAGERRPPQDGTNAVLAVVSAYPDNGSTL